MIVICFVKLIHPLNSSLGASINYVGKQGEGRGSLKCHWYYISLFIKRVNEGGRGGQKSSNFCQCSSYRVTQVKLWLFKSVILWNGKIKVRLQNKFIKLAIWIFQKRVQKNLKTLFWASKRTFYFFTKKSTGCFLPIFITELKYTYKKWWSFWAPYIMKIKK